MHAEHAIGRFLHGGFTRACRVMAAVRPLRTLMDVDMENTTDTKESEYAAISYRTAVVPLIVYVGAAIKNSGTILTDLAPWIYLGITVALLACAQTFQRRKRRAWPWSIALTVGFCIAAIAILASMGISAIFAPSELTPT